MAQPTPQKKMSDQSRTVLYIVGAILSVGLAIWSLSGLFSRNQEQVDRAIASEAAQKERAAAEAVRKKRELDEFNAKTPVVARPIRLFHEFIAAIARDNKTEINKLSDFGLDKYDLLMTPERVKLFAEAYSMKKYTVLDAETKMDSEKAFMAATIKNQRNMDVEEIGFYMERRPGGAENWKVVEVENRWFASSGHTPESMRVILGADRTKAAKPLTSESSFQVAPEADPAPQAWLATTTDDQKKLISEQMKILLNDDHPAKASKASQVLVNFGKDAIPALLTELAKYDVRKDDDNRHANAIDRTLAVMTDREMGYDAIGLESSVAVPGALTPAQARVRAVRRWFGWWGAQKDKPLVKRTQAADAEDPKKR